MTFSLKNTPFLSEDDDLYRDWIQSTGDFDPKTAEVFGKRDADAFARLWLGRFKGTSPHLTRLFFAERDFAARVFELGAPAAFAELLKKSYPRLYASENAETAGQELRRLKRRGALAIAMADLSGVWNLGEVTHALSVLAEACLRAATAVVLRGRAAKGELVLADESEPEKGCGFFIVAMGKLGARELNYSSDVDLIMLYDADKAPYAGKRDVGAFFVRVARDIVALIDDKTSSGYVFRVDLRLRPDPGSTPVALSTQAAACYYESFAQNWERAAFIKARVVAGDKAVGTAFLKEIKPFVWRRTTDFYALKQIGDIKRSLGARSSETPDKAGFNIKLGQGGIREIEFFTQLQQLLWGGRDPSLRARSTVVALNALVKAGWVSAKDRDDLVAAYDFLRTLEHRLQMTDDRQTQTLPTAIEDQAALARLAGFDDYGGLLRALGAHCAAVRRVYDSLFAGENRGDADAFSFGGADVPAETAAKLREFGFSDIDRIGETVRGWLSGRYRALRSDRARELMTDLLPVLFAALAKSDNPDAAFLSFDELLRGLPAGVQLFSLFQSRPALLDLLAELISAVPALAGDMIRHADLFDAVLNPSFFQPFPDAAAMVSEILALPEWAEDDEEAALDALRRFAREKRFRCAVQFLRGLIDRDGLTGRLTDLATAVLTALCPVVTRAFEKKYGAFENAAFSVVLLGKAGSGEMSFSSDLDILFIYDVPDGAAESAGGTSPLTVGVYYARLAHKIVNALTANTADGVLWSVDMRLRPSGSAGPAATSFESFARYYENDAWTWELMALTKARVVWGEKEKIDAEIRKNLRRSRNRDELRRDVVEMREKIRENFRPTGAAEAVKYGRGGMIDIEFSAQYLQLLHADRHPEILQRAVVPVLARAVGAGLIDRTAGDALMRAYRLWTLLSALFSLCVENPKSDWDDLSDTTKRLMCRFTGAGNEAELRREIDGAARSAASFLLFGNGDRAL